MNSWTIEYKCRRCGHTIRKGSESKASAMQTIELAVGGLSHGMVQTHTCFDGALGVCDLIGCAEVKP